MDRTLIDHDVFGRWVREVLANLYDVAVLETHPLAQRLPRPPGTAASRAEQLRHLTRTAIERLRPSEAAIAAGSVEARPYVILQQRYIEGESLQSLEARLALSARQLRREHARAMDAITAILWDQIVGAAQPALDAENGATAFQVASEALDLGDIVHSVILTLRHRLEAEGVTLRSELDPLLPPCQADRVVLRQILLSLINAVLLLREDGELTLRAQTQHGQIVLALEARMDPTALSPGPELLSDTVRYWLGRLDANLCFERVTGAPSGTVRWRLSLPAATQTIVMVIDDQEPAIQLFERYLSRTDVRVVGMSDPGKALEAARKLQPQAITLDVMMPTLDGWELLQALKADPETREIPVIVCSVWDEPELASSLGAAAFLKKPITQAALLQALNQALLDRRDARSSVAC